MQLALQMPGLTGFLHPCILWPPHLLQLKLFCGFGTYRIFARADAPTFFEGIIDTAAFCLWQGAPPQCWAESHVPTEALEHTPEGDRQRASSEVGKGKALFKEIIWTDDMSAIAWVNFRFQVEELLATCPDSLACCLPSPQRLFLSLFIY